MPLFSSKGEHTPLFSSIWRVQLPRSPAQIPSVSSPDDPGTQGAASIVATAGRNNHARSQAQLLGSFLPQGSHRLGWGMKVSFVFRGIFSSLREQELHSGPEPSRATIPERLTHTHLVTLQQGWQHAPHSAVHQACRFLLPAPAGHIQEPGPAGIPRLAGQMRRYKLDGTH